MSRVTLVSAEDGVSGNIGLIIKGMSTSSEHIVTGDHEGLVLAHDILEHVVTPAIDLSRIGELMALGSGWFVRGSYGGYRRGGDLYRTPHEIVAHDLARICADHISDEESEWWNPAKLDQVRISGIFQDEVRDIRGRVRRLIRTELGDRGDEGRPSASKLDLIVNRAMKLFIIGLRAAQRRYKFQAHVNQMFWDIADAIKPYASPELTEIEYELTYILVSGEVRIRQIEEEIW